MAPPQKPTSTNTRPRAESCLIRSASTSHVGGMLFSGMSSNVVTPPAAAARVAASKPSHSVRPGSLTCTCVSTRPGRSTSSSASTTTLAADRSASNASTETMRPARMPTAAGRFSGRGDHAPRSDDEIQRVSIHRDQASLRSASDRSADSWERATIAPMRSSSGPASAMHRATSGSRSVSAYAAGDRRPAQFSHVQRGCARIRPPPERPRAGPHRPLRSGPCRPGSAGPASPRR